PLILLVLDIYPLRRLGGPADWRRPAAREVWVEKIPFAVVGLLASAVALVAVGPSGALHSLAEFGIVERLAVSAYGVVFYLTKTVAPWGLSPLYEMPPRPLDALRVPFLVNGGVALTLLVVAVAGRRRWPALAAAGAVY